MPTSRQPGAAAASQTATESLPTTVVAAVGLSLSFVACATGQSDDAAAPHANFTSAWETWGSPPPSRCLSRPFDIARPSPLVCRRCMCGVSTLLSAEIYHTTHSITPYVAAHSSAGQSDDAAALHANFTSAWETWGWLPEVFGVDLGAVHPEDPGYNLRPEHIESTWYLAALTGGYLSTDRGTACVHMHAGRGGGVPLGQGDMHLRSGGCFWVLRRISSRFGAAGIPQLAEVF